MLSINAIKAIREFQQFRAHAEPSAWGGKTKIEQISSLEDFYKVYQTLSSTASIAKHNGQENNLFTMPIEVKGNGYCTAFLSSEETGRILVCTLYAGMFNLDPFLSSTKRTVDFQTGYFCMNNDYFEFGYLDDSSRNFRCVGEGKRFGKIVNGFLIEEWKLIRQLVTMWQQYPSASYGGDAETGVIRDGTFPLHWGELLCFISSNFDNHQGTILNFLGQKVASDIGKNYNLYHLKTAGALATKEWVEVTAEIINCVDHYTQKMDDLFNQVVPNGVRGMSADLGSALLLRMRAIFDNLLLDLKQITGQEIMSQ